MELEEKFDPAILPDLLPLYYKRLFPHQLIYRWLSYGNSEDGIFTHREISFTLMDDIYIRYLSFENESEFKNEICSRNPFKIDIGAVMSRRPKDHRTATSIQPVQRELVFDIDMTDYDEVRTCCEGADVCTKCWKFMIIACRILDSALREDFGFEHLLWVFSGRRGIHCWVCDKEARHLDVKSRGAVAEYLQLLIHGGENSVSRVVIDDKVHHSIKRALDVIEPIFEEVCLVDQNLFGSENGLTKLLLQRINDDNIRKELEKELKNFQGNSKAIWEYFVRFINSQKGWKFQNLISEIQLALTYPRLDINVTKGFNHLLKAPFCVHPKTGKICVPFNPNAAAKFDPTSVPTINSLLKQINKFDKAEGEEVSRIKDYKKTDLVKAIMIFEEFLKKLGSSYSRLAIKVSDEKMDF